jgi:acyl dehydratase
MPPRASAVGHRYRPREVDISKRDLLSFAAGLGIDWALAMADDRPGGVAGFPTYCASLEYNTFRAAADESGNAIGVTQEEAYRAVHAGQDSFFHLPIRPGDRLKTEGVLISARNTPAGALFVVKAMTTRTESDDLVTTSWISHLYRGLALVGEATQIAAAPEMPAVLPTGEPTVHKEIIVRREWPHIYAECSNIWNPIHSERSVALAAGLSDIILQGTATWGVAAREIVRAYCDEDPARLARIRTRFAGIVLPGDTLYVDLYEPQNGSVPFAVSNQHGKPVLREGMAEIR